MAYNTIGAPPSAFDENSTLSLTSFVINKKDGMLYQLYKKKN